jgi:hypothetical protein
MMTARCPRCDVSGLPAFAGDTETLCSTHALQVLDEIVDELITNMKDQRPLAEDDPGRA